MNEFRDENLRQAFDALRSDTLASAPSFSNLTSPMAMNTWRRRQRRRRGALLAAAITLPLFLALWPRAPRELDFERFTALTGLDPGEVTWRAPSDFLLDIPGNELLRTVPLIEVTVPSIPADSAARADSAVTRRRRSDS